MRSAQAELYETSCAEIWLMETPLKPWTSAIWENGGHSCSGHMTSIKSNFFLISGHISPPSFVSFRSFSVPFSTNVGIFNKGSAV